MRLAGYAALFQVPDAARDLIRPGAFAASLASRSDLPLLWQHRPAQRIGRVERAAEDVRGLRVIARLDPATLAAQLLADGAVSGLSFGYRARDYRLTPRGRELVEVELLEISLVTHPLQHGARVHFIDPPPARLGRGTSRSRDIALHHLSGGPPPRHRRGGFFCPERKANTHG
ncbi:HK97 family phage prohead protease [Qipengyuania sediminis]|uniref:HK97 family phage prohead protease n=1 Tax=Qipengyuania sediminis TaxID=1532023 RepID=UPI003083F6E9